MPKRQVLLTFSILFSLVATLAQPRATNVPARKTFNHPKGFSFQYPADWRVESNAEFTQLLPPGLTAEDQTENLRILTETVPVDAADQRFTAELDQLAAQLPGFSKVGATQSYPTKGGVGVRGIWAGRNMQTQQAIQIRMYATTVHGLAIVLFAAGQTGKLEARESSLRDIALSVAATTAAAAPSAPTSGAAASVDRSPLAQQWLQRLRGKKLTKMSSYSSGSSGGMSSKTEIYLQANGSFQGRSESSVAIYVEGANGSSGGVQKAAGTWRIYVQDGRAILEMKYENGQVESSLLEDRSGQTFINGKRVFVTEQ